MVAGINGRAKAGVKGALALAWWNESEQEMEICVGKVGKNGIKADTWYKVSDGVLVECEE